MAIYRAPRPEYGFTILDNQVLRDTRLSFRARGLLAMILSNTDDWSVTSEDLSRQGTEGRDAIRTALTELEDAGYLRRERRRGQDGRFSTQAVVYDTPRAETRSVQEDLFTGTGTPGPENPAPVNPAPGNQSSIEEPTKNTLPPEATPEPKTKPPADLIAAAVYEAMDKMGNYLAIRKVAAQALRAGFSQEATQAAMLGLVEQARPITGQLVREALQGSQGGTIRETNRDHWTNGGGFTAEEGPKP